MKENKTILKIDELEKEEGTDETPKDCPPGMTPSPVAPGECEESEALEEELDEGGVHYNKDDETEEEEIDPKKGRGALEEDEEPLAEAHDKRRCDIYERLMKEWISK